MIGAKIWRATLGLSLLVAAAPLTFADPVTKDAKERVLDRMNKIITNFAYVPGVDFAKWPQMLAAVQPDVDKAQTDADFQEAVNKALSGFGLTHISLQTPQQSRTRLDGETVGLGVSVHVQPDGILIIRVVPKSAAETAKLQPGDLIVAADGKQVRNPAELAGKEGQPVLLTVKAADGKSRQVKVVRKKFSTIRPEELTWVDKDTALLKVYTFDLSYRPTRVEGLMREASKAKNLVIDLRDNGGGVVLNVQHFLGLLLPDSTPIGTFINKRLVERYVKEASGNPDDLKSIAAWSDSKVRSTRDDDEPKPFSGNVAVLVNGGTGSGAEIAAAALRERLGATVVGTKSAGAVLVALMVPLPEGYTLLYPITDYVTTRGIRLEGNGVQPDLTAEDPKVPLPGTPDDVISKAVAALQHPDASKKAIGVN